MQDEPLVFRTTAPPAEAVTWAKRLDNPKITVWTVVGFIAILGLLCAVAAGVGYVTHGLGHPRIPQ